MSDASTFIDKLIRKLGEMTAESRCDTLPPGH